MNITAIILLVLKASIFLMVFAIGLKATFNDATFLFRRPGQLARALLAMNVLMPLLAVILVLTFDFHPASKIALVAISVSPIPPIIPNKMLKVGGREDYTIGLLVATASLSVVVIPVAMQIFERVGGVPMSMRARSVAGLVLMTVLVPLVLGILVRKVAQRLADRFAKPLVVISMLLLVLTVIPVLIAVARPIFSLIGDGTILILSFFALFGLVVGHILGPEADDRPVLALATAARHPAIAIAIAHQNFPNQTLTVPAVFLYVLLSTVLSAIYQLWAKRQRSLTSALKPTAGV